jgi:copper chaperone CopZ
VGKAALEGLPGVKKVENGFRGMREVNIVSFDPAEITVDEMVEALTRAGTYRGTAK